MGLTLGPLAQLFTTLLRERARAHPVTGPRRVDDAPRADHGCPRPIAGPNPVRSTTPFPPERLAPTARSSLDRDRVVVPGAGHLVTDEEPDVVRDFVVDVLAPN